MKVTSSHRNAWRVRSQINISYTTINDLSYINYLELTSIGLSQMYVALITNSQ